MYMLVKKESGYRFIQSVTDYEMFEHMLADEVGDLTLYAVELDEDEAIECGLFMK